MSASQAALLALGTFVFGLVVLPGDAVLDVGAAYLAGPVVALAAASYAAYRTGLDPTR